MSSCATSGFFSSFFHDREASQSPKEITSGWVESAKTALSRSTWTEGVKKLMFGRFREQWFSEVSDRNGLRSKIGPVSEEAYQLILETRVKLILR